MVQDRLRGFERFGSRRSRFFLGCAVQDGEELAIGKTVRRPVSGIATRWQQGIDVHLGAQQKISNSIQHLMNKGNGMRQGALLSNGTTGWKANL
jgi:hypothetical protein